MWVGYRGLDYLAAQVATSPCVRSQIGARALAASGGAVLLLTGVCSGLARACGVSGPLFVFQREVGVEPMSEPVGARSHVAVQQEQEAHGWFAMLRAWIKGVGRCIS